MRKTQSSKPYPRPGRVGGKLIREAIATLRAGASSRGTGKSPLLPNLPIDAHILIAVSGGPDSTALAILLTRYGRRVAARKRIRWVHVNHGWRGLESDADEAFVRAAAKRLGVPLSVFRLDPKKAARNGRSPEEAARGERKRIFAKLSRKYGSKRGCRHEPAWIFTAHHADDLAETMVWRFFSGTLGSHGGGIALCHDRELRPFLRVRKKELLAFLREEGESWREDRTNFEGVLLRSRLRLHVMPAVEALFPRAVEHLTQLALEVQSRDSAAPEVDPAVLFSASGLAVRRAHWEWLRKRKPRQGRLSLPGGWALSNSSTPRRERWVLERPCGK